MKRSMPVVNVLLGYAATSTSMTGLLPCCEERARANCTGYCTGRIALTPHTLKFPHDLRNPAL